MPFPTTTDPDTEVEALLAAEVERQTTGLQLIASENFTSPAVMAATGSVLTNKYSEGYPGKRYYGGNVIVDSIEQLAIDRVKELFGADHANVQPHSGANANMCVYQALLEPGDTVLGLSLDHGGHLTHGSPVNASGLLYNFVAYGTGAEDRIEMDEVRELALKHRPKMIVAGTTSYPRRLDPEPFKQIADEVGALLMFDIAHLAGLVAGGAHPNPVPYADVVTFTTHKTLRGPRGGCILCKDEHAKAIDKAVFPGWQGGPLEHVIAGKAIAFREAMDPSFTEYAHQVVTNASALAEALVHEGFRLVSGGTDNHLMVVDLTPVRRRTDRQGRPGDARRGRHHVEQEHDPRRSAQPVRHQRRPDRHPVGHDAGHDRGRDADHRRPHRPGAAPRRRCRGARLDQGRSRLPLRQVPRLLSCAVASPFAVGCRIVLTKPVSSQIVVNPHDS